MIVKVVMYILYFKLFEKLLLKVIVSYIFIKELFCLIKS